MSAYVKAGHYSTRSDFVHTAKNHFKSWYSDGSWDKEEPIRRTVNWLLEKDRFTCSQELMHVSFRLSFQTLQRYYADCIYIEGTSERPFRTPRNKQSDIRPFF